MVGSAGTTSDVRDLKAWLGIGLTAAAIGAALLAPWLAPHDPMKADFVQSLRPPGSRRGRSSAAP